MIQHKRIEVKVAHLSFTSDKNSCMRRYCFELKHKGSKNNEDVKCDYYFLVFLDAKKIPMYSIVSSAFVGLKTLCIRESLISKYPLKLIGYLDRR